MATQASDVSVRFSAAGHLLGTQFWKVEFANKTVKLILAYRREDEVAVIGQAVANGVPQTQTFLKHFMVPSKSGRTALQKALARAKHRKVATTLLCADANAHKLFTAARKPEPAGNWARDTTGWDKATQPGKYPSATPPQWRDFRTEAALDMEYLKAGGQLDWHDKYGGLEEVVINTVLVLNGVKLNGQNVVRNWPNVGGLAPVVPASVLHVAERIANALEACEAWEPMYGAWEQTAGTVDVTFDQACVLVVTAGNQQLDGAAGVPPQVVPRGIPANQVVAPTYGCCSSIKIRACRPTRDANRHDYVLTHLVSAGALTNIVPP